MRPSYRRIILPGLCVLAICALAACGGGGGNASAPPVGHNFSGGGTNVVAVTVGPGPAKSNSQTFNIPFVTVTVCQAGTSTCATVDHVLVDTGSSGLRLMASALAAQGLTLSPMPDPGNATHTIHECLPFADGYAWGPVASADVTIGTEASTHAIAVQVIDDGQTPTPAAPKTCTSHGTSLNSVDAFDANGVLGVGTSNQDCGSGCANSALEVYYSCDTGGNCSPTAQPLADQVANPVASFAVDNNGVILQLPAIAADGAPYADGYLVFGIGTENNNGLGTAEVLTTDTEGLFITDFQSQALDNSFIDSGSNTLYFPNSSSSPIPLCGAQGTSAGDFYCPTATESLSATNQGQNGTTSQVSFQVANMKQLSRSNFALDDVGGPAQSIAISNYFDWGLPFFYGRTVFTAIEGTSAGGIAGPFFAY